MSEFLEENGSSGGVSPRPWHEAWIQYIMDFPMPSVEDEAETKETIVAMLNPIMNVASRSFILRREIPMHLDSYDIIWDKYFMYMKRGKYNSNLLVLRETLREGFELQLNRSVDAAQMRMIFEPKQSIFQKLVTGSGERRVGLFKTKKKNEGNVENVDMDRR